MCILGEPTEGKVVLGHFGSLWLRLSTQRQLHPHGVHARASDRRTRSCACTTCSTRCSSGSRRGRTIPSNSYRGAKAIVGVSGGPGRLRLARLADAAPHRPLPRRARAADEGDGGRAPRGAGHGARPAGALPRARRRGRGLRDRAGRRDRRGARARRGARRRARGGLRRGAGARRDALVLGRLGADALRHRRRSTTARRPACSTPSWARTSTSTGSCRPPTSMRESRSGSAEPLSGLRAAGRPAGAVDDGACAHLEGMPVPQLDARVVGRARSTWRDSARSAACSTSIRAPASPEPRDRRPVGRDPRRAGVHAAVVRIPRSRRRSYASSVRGSRASRRSRSTTRLSSRSGSGSCTP